MLHTGLKEMWFGWRVKKIFVRQEAFQRYCHGEDEPLDLEEVSRTQKIRFWISGSYSGIMGLPLAEAAALLQRFGIDVV